MGGKPRVARELEEAANRQLTLGILEAAPGGIVHVDSSGAMLSANQEALRILGMSFDKLSCQYVVDFHTDTIWEDGSACPPAAYPVSQALVTGESQPRATIGVRRPDGEVSWAVFAAVPVKDAQGVTTGAVATFLDITERKKLEEARRSSEATLSSVVESAPSFILTVDRSATILFSNRDDLGQERKSLVGEDLYQAFAELGAADFRQPIESVLAGGEPVGFQLQLQVSKGIRQFAVRAGAVKSGEVVEGVTLVASDITEFSELQSRLIVSERLAALGTLAAGVAHEINNPLTYLLLKLSALANAAEAEQNTQQVTDLCAAIDGAQRIAGIVRDLGTVSRLESKTSESVNLSKVLDVAINMVRVETKARATVRKSCDALSVKGDEARLVQVFLNLLINAAQAIEEGNVGDNEISVIASQHEDSRICIQVKDTGRGIPPKDVERVFEPFYTTKGHREGTGLGLHVCHQIVTSLGGELTVQSALGQGSCFSVYLPSAEVHTPREEHDQGDNTEKAAKACHHILVVDDEGLIRETLQMLLRGHEVTLAATGREAIELLKADDFDVVFCDLIMPDLTGVDVFKYLYTEGKGRQEKIVFMTGGTFKTQTQEFLQSVSNRVLLKPFPLEELHSCLPS